MSLQSAVAHAAEVFSDDWTARQVGEAMTCSEADALADVFRAAGFTDEALAFLKGHAEGESGEGDELGDDHYYLRADAVEQG
jgi:hypothetical protein